MKEIFEVNPTTEKHERGDNIIVNVVLIRHGEKIISTKNVATVLTKEGEEQAKEFGKSRKGGYLKSYYSPTDRTKETARLITESNPSIIKGAPRAKEELAFKFKSGGDFEKKIQQFRKRALVPEAEELSPEELEEKIKCLKEKSREEFNKRLKLGADLHTEYYLNFGKNKPDEFMDSPAEVAALISKLLLHYIELSRKLYSGSRVDLINVTHDLNIAAFLDAILKNIDKEFNIIDAGGSIKYTEGCEVIIHRLNEKELNVKLLFRGKEYNIDENILRKVASTK